MNRGIGIACLVLVALTVLGQPLLLPRDAMATDAERAFRSPGADHPMGTDSVGRDVLARLVAGTWHTLVVALVALTLSSAIGLVVGSMAGLVGGLPDRALTATIDLLIAFPQFVILVNVAAMLSFGTSFSLGLLIGCISWMGTARMVRTEMLSLRERPFVEAARAAGAAQPRVARVHLIPHLLRLVRERIGLRFAGVVLLAASLDYLGIGLSADRPTWGGLIRDGQQYLDTAPWIAISAVLLLCLTTIGVVLAGERRPLRATQFQ